MTELYTINALLNMVANGLLVIASIALYFSLMKRYEKVNLFMTICLFLVAFGCANRAQVDYDMLVKGGKLSTYLFIFPLVRNYATLGVFIYLTLKNYENKRKGDQAPA
jgi:hypothetical protein